MTTDILTLIGQSVDLRRTASTNGGEFHGACPFCGGHDRFTVWPNAARPGWWCRMCEKGGDAIQFLREQGHSFPDACRMLGVEMQPAKLVQTFTPPLACQPPNAAWRHSAAGFALWAHGQLTDAARAYLHGRGLTDKTIAAAQLGYNPTTLERSRVKWGLEPDREYGDRFWIPAGIVIPCRISDQLWKVQIRRDVVRDGQDRYKTLPGSANALYGADSIEADRPAMLVEGPFDALAVRQVAGDAVAAVASGTSGARRSRWQMRLALASVVLVSLDADAAGDEASGWWLRNLANARRWRPSYADPGQMLEDGADVRAWVLAGLGLRAATFGPIATEFWQEALANGWSAHLDRLRHICAEQGADYDATVTALRSY